MVDAEALNIVKKVTPGSLEFFRKTEQYSN